MPELTVARSEGWLWLTGSLLLAILWANLAWFFRQPRSGTIGEFVTRLVAWHFSPWLFQLLRLLYYIGVPYAALLWGHSAVVERYLGLSSGGEVGADVAARWLDWTCDAGWAVALGIGAWALLALGWWTHRRALATASEESTVAGANCSGWVLLREAAYHEVHWAFYRNAPIVMWEKHTGDAYWGIWGGLALVTLEAVLNPAWRKGLADLQEAPAHLMRGALAVVSSVLFLLTGNLWLALALHWGVSWGLAALVRALPLLPARKSNQVTARNVASSYITAHSSSQQQCQGNQHRQHH
ncbi:MAG: hypothetical protein ACE5OS_11835 [Anaerolineae bacterium]